MADVVTEPPVRQAPRRRLPDFGGRSEGAVARLSIAPGQLLMLFLVAFPAAVAIYIGFTEWTPTSSDNVWGAYHYWHWFDGYWEALRSARLLARDVADRVVHGRSRSASSSCSASRSRCSS